MALQNPIGSKLQGNIAITNVPTTTGVDGWGFLMRAADGTLKVLPTQGAAPAADKLTAVPPNTIIGRNETTAGDSEALTPDEVKTMLGLTNAVVPDPATGLVDPALLPPVVLPSNLVYTDPDPASPDFGLVPTAVMPRLVVIKDPATGLIPAAALPPLDPAQLPTNVVTKNATTGKIDPAILPVNVPGGVPLINATTGKIDSAFLPPSGGSGTFASVASEAARLTLTNPLVGDTVKQADNGEVYRLIALPATWEKIGDAFITASDIQGGVFAPERLGVAPGGAVPNDTMILQGDGNWVPKSTLAPESQVVLVTAAGSYTATKNATHVITATNSTPAAPVVITLPLDNPAIALTPASYNDKFVFHGATDKAFFVKVPTGITVWFPSGDSMTNDQQFGTYTADFGGIQEKYVSFELNRIGLNAFMMTRLNGNLW
jgi:hypothetical protein